MSRPGGRPPLSYLPYLLILALTLLLLAAPHFLRLPIPAGASAATSAMLSINGGPEQAVALPHRWPRLSGTGPVEAVYRLSIDLPASETAFLMIPGAQHALSARLDGRRVTGTDIPIAGEPSVGAPYLLEIPDARAGPATLEITLRRDDGLVPGYLSPVYAADAQAIAGTRWIWLFVTRGTRVSVVALQAIVILALATVWLARRNDPIFAWLFLIGAGSLLYSIANTPGADTFTIDGQPVLVLVMPSFGLMAVGLALSIMEARRPAWLKASIAALPAVLIAGVALHVLPPAAGIALGSLVAIGGHAVAATLLACDALRRDEWDRALLAVPFFVVAWYGLRDIGIVTGMVDGALLLSGKIRLVTMIAVLTLLMRRLVSSLDALDRSNETLRLKLAAREEELSHLHAKEKALTEQATREQERGRLMRDLHDGLSGHLVSIIALSQDRAAEPASIERAARGALDDLRLVINSLDLDDGDLLPALAGLRERLEPQLRRLGIELDWSMEKLPQAHGVTPGSALSILRIVQEAITNAVRHGASGRLRVRGAAGRGGTLVLTVGNEARTDAPRGQGHGLRNMQRRAAELGGAVRLDLADGQATLTVVLPSTLPE